MESHSEQRASGAGSVSILTFCQDFQKQLNARGVWIGLPVEWIDRYASPNIVPVSLLQSWLDRLPDQSFLSETDTRTGQDFNWNIVQSSGPEEKITGFEIEQNDPEATQLHCWAMAPLFFPGRPSGLLLAVRESPFSSEDLKQVETAGHELQKLVDAGSDQGPQDQTVPGSEAEDWLIHGDGPDLQQRLLDLLALHRLNLQTGTTQDLHSSLDIVAQTLNALLPEANTVTMMLLDESGMLKIAAVHGRTAARYPANFQLRPGEGLRGQAALLGIPLNVPMVHNDRRYIELDPGVQSMLVVPVNGPEGKLLGILSAESKVPNAFNPYDENILKTAAAQTANLIENARLFESEHRRTAEVNSLIELGKTIIQSLEIDQVFTAVYQTITRLMPCDAFYISLREAQSQNTSVTHLIDNGVRYPPTRWPIESGLSGHVIRSGDQVLIGDMLKESLPFQGVFYGKPDQVRSLIACPLRYHDHTKGMVSCQSYKPATYTSHDLSLLQSIADHVAIAVENMEMYVDLNNRYLTLQELERVRGEIIQNVSHELRTPLTFLRSYIELLIDEQLGSLNERQKNSLKIVQARTDTLVRLVDDITTLEASDPDWLKYSDVDLAELAANALQVVEQLARERENQLILEVAPDFPIIRADPDRINQVLDNLLGNALKYGQKASKIVVRLETDGDHVIVSVSNLGDSIPEREQERIFERFYQINGSISRRQSGLGLGLAIVKRIIDAHDGTVWVQSDKEMGSTFYFSLPVKPSGQ